MEFDNAKENIQPLACGRDASILHASITQTARELMEQRREHEATIHAYNGDDPLEAWYNYVSWIEQMFPSGGKESGLMQVLGKCLRRFESEERYYQDRRMIKLFIKFLYNNKEPLECFQQLFNGGIGTMVADFYIAWAYCYDSIGQMQKADEMFRRGIDCRAEPLHELKEAYQHFRMAVGERVLYKDDNDALKNTNRQLEERRLALSSLRGYRKRAGEVGSIRTGAAIKSYKPGTVQNDPGLAPSTSANARVTILKDENVDPNAAGKQLPESSLAITTETEEIKSINVIRSIVDNVRHQENEHEPGPWNKVHDKKNAKKLMRQKKITHDIGFSIHEDIDMEEEDDEKTTHTDEIVLPDADKCYEKPFKYPANFVNKNRPQTEWVLPVTTEIEPDPRSFPCYNKCMVYPRSNREFQMEEFMAYRFYEKRKVENEITRRYKSVWSVNDISAPVRTYPNFARHSNPQKLDDLDAFYMEPYVEGMFTKTTQIYDETAQEEFQLEELMAREWFSSQNKTVMEPQDMDETNCASSNNEQVQRRKSFFPMRRSMAIRKIVTEIENNQNEKTEKHVTFAEETQAIDVEDQENFGAAAVIPVQQQSNSPFSTASTNKPSSFVNDVNAVSATGEATSANNENDFPFKLPALPITSSKIQNENLEEVNSASSAVVSNKLPFEIFVEESNGAHAAPVQNTFDAEETCSTQIFNICLKSQSASTPKIEQKTQKRQFNVLRDVEQSKPTSPAAAVISASSISSTISSTSPSESDALKAVSYSLSPQSPVSPDNDAVLAAAGITGNSYSPPLRKQLSTILETSEHGTHSTGTSKSSNGTTQISEISEAATAHQTQKTQLEAVENTQAMQEVISSMAEVQIVSDQVMSNQSVNATTQFDKALQNSPTATSNLSHLQNNSEAIKEAVNLTCMETNQMRGEAAVVDNPRENQPQSLQSNLKFSIFEDPTETVPKITNDHISAAKSVAGNFERLHQCDDSTIGNIPVQPVRFQQDQTETLTKFMKAPYFPEDKTETVHLNMPANANTQTMDTELKSLVFCEDEFDTNEFEFFRKSPSKFQAAAWKNEMNQSRSKSQLTPLSDVATKRICIQETPVEFKKTAAATTSIGNSALYANTLKTNFVNTNKNLLDTFMDDFTLPSNKATTANRATTLKGSDKLPDCSVPEFSYVEDTQPTNDAVRPAEVSIRNTFRADDVSVIEETQETQKDRSKGAIPKIFQHNRSKLQESLLMPPPIEPFFVDHETAESKKVDLLMSRCNLQGETSSILQGFSFIDDNEGLKSNKMSKPNISCMLPVEKEPKKSPQNLHEFSLKMQDTTKSKETQNHTDKLMNSFFMDSSATASATNKKAKPIIESQKNAAPTPTVDELLESFSKSNMMDLSHNFKQARAPARESLIPRFVMTQSQPKNNKTSTQPHTFLTPSKSQSNQWPQAAMSNNMSTFDLNAEGDTFATGINLLKNSTMLPTTPTQSDVKQSMIQEPSLHIKTEATSIVANVDENSTAHVNLGSSTNNCRSARSLMPEVEDEMSIYYKNTPRTPQINENSGSWHVDNSGEEFIHEEIDLDETTQVIETKCINGNVNPFDADLINAFLDKVDFISFLKKEPNNTMLIGNVKRLQQNLRVEINNVSFKVDKLLGQGNYGTVYCGVNIKTGKKYALKQERPPNYWEYYICLEVQERIKNDDMLLSYMRIELAQIGNNASIFVSTLAPYGSIIAVCNKIKKVTTKNIDEYVVMHLTCELLEIIDHLHAADIIHADLKSDNFLFMRKLSYNSKTTALHLIDFGVSIDMRQFKQTQVFSYVHTQDAFKCTEMRENRPWTYQLDLYGLAGVIHVLLFGKYMEIEKQKTGWLPKQHMPRYINKTLWEHIFRTLLNIRDCRLMPDLQKLRQMLKEEMAEKEHFVINKIADFNKALDA